MLIKLHIPKTLLMNLRHTNLYFLVLIRRYIFESISNNPQLTKQQARLSDKKLRSN